MNNEDIVHVPQYKWAKTVKKLDNNKCAYCGSETRLQAHHIIPKSVESGEANNLENGITLCDKCHRHAHSVGYHRAPEHYAIMEAVNPNTQMGRMNAFIQEYVDTTMLIAFPSGRLEAIEAYAKMSGYESVNGYINGLIRADMGLSEEEWKGTEKKEEK